MRNSRNPSDTLPAALLRLAILLSLSACAGLEKQAQDTKARGTIEAGGYTWKIPMESEGGNRVQTNGLPNQQAATEAASILCKKNGRIAQYVKQDGMPLLGVVWFDFNCVK